MSTTRRRRGSKRKRQETEETGEREEIERVNLLGGPGTGIAPNSGHPPGTIRGSKEPSLLNFVDFEKILADANITSVRSVSDSTPPPPPPAQQTLSPNVLPSAISASQQTLPTLQSISFAENRVRLGSDDIASHVPEQLCKKIWAHEYINLALLLKGSVELQDLFSTGVVHLTGKGQLEARPQVNTKDKVPNIEKWTDAFLIFASIYLKRYPSKIQEILQYMNIIREAASRSVTFTWRSYDEQFRLRQESEVQSWGKINSDLWLRLMTSSTVTSNIPQNTQPGALTGGRSSTGNSQYDNHVLGTCFDFNDGFCPRTVCKFKHICSNCNNPSHGRVTCFKQSTANSRGSYANRGGSNFRGPRGYTPNRGGRLQARRGNRL